MVNANPVDRYVCIGKSVGRYSVCCPKPKTPPPATTYLGICLTQDNLTQPNQNPTPDFFFQDLTITVLLGWGFSGAPGAAPLFLDPAIEC